MKRFGFVIAALGGLSFFFSDSYTSAVSTVSKTVLVQQYHRYFQLLEKTMEKIFSTRIMNYGKCLLRAFSSTIQKKCELLKLRKVPEKSLYEQFFLDAQKQLGVISSDILPVYKAEGASWKKVYALCDHAWMMVNDAKLSVLPHGMLRFVSLHEAAHYFYCHRCVICSLFVPAFCAFVLAGSTMSGAGVSWLSVAAMFCMRGYCEYQADKVAVRELSCAICAQEALSVVHKNSDVCSIKRNRWTWEKLLGAWGYLTRKEFEHYIHQFKKNDLLCAYHRSASLQK